MKGFPIEAITDILAHRGPDGSGIYTDEQVALGHRRLSIIDVAGGAQPIFNADGSKCIVYNGEVFNFQELRRDLFDKGYVFKTRSDTETILHAYEEWGERCVELLRGMFVLAIWDRRQGKLFIARDRLGIKPLFYAEHGGRFYFASEMKAILAETRFPRQIDETALAAYFTYSYIPAPLTIYRHIRKLLPGHTLTWQAGRVEIKQYWDLVFAPDRSRDEGYFIERFLALFEESVRMRLISEVPLGAFLSGGIDSSAVVAMMSRGSAEPVKTFCIGFGGATGGYLDERGYARLVAQRYGADHSEYEVIPSFKGLVEKIVCAFDEPFADDSAIPSYFVCQMARKGVTVALSGLGGDEAFAGYERYFGFHVSRFYRMLPLLVRDKIIGPMVEKIPERSDGHYTVNHIKRFARSGALSPDMAYIGYVSRLNGDMADAFFVDGQKFNALRADARDLMLAHFRSDKVDGDLACLNRAFYYDMKTYLPEDILAVTDRMSMQHALEVRVPFVDHKVLEFCATIPPEMKMRWFSKKYLLKKATRNLLPAAVIDHRKQGFVGPMAQWLKYDLKKYVQETLTRRNLERHGYLNFDVVQRLLNEHFSGRQIHDTLIWSMLVFQKWYDLYIDRR
ncbi:asparagine synthase (glutamine-hydrolyzing) [Desulfatitalea sp. M08but]|uniref:asparagine synthase (glutamine-hydrolyzing) n=2 Tax=Desulfatitalea alkaliphila TaxID=2929485 RepID=A0AA41R7L1_9BACT|nr:asparagine synthase (glutamine-hydrolyzing) [Desulfatitalea alkaliphila]